MRFFALLTCLLFSCAAPATDDIDEPATGCLETGCDAGSVCNSESDLCEPECNGPECDGIDPVLTCVETGCDDTTWCNADTGSCETDILIPDERLAGCIRFHLSRGDVALTVTDAQALRFLSCPDRDIADLTGMEHFVNLERLSLWENQIVELEPLAGLTQLTWLQLGHNQIITPYFLGELTHLTRLGLAYNELILIGPLANLTELEWLSLDGNQLIDVSALADLDNLTWLTLEGNDIADLSVVNALEAGGTEVYKRRPNAGIEIAGIDETLRVDVDTLFANASLHHYAAPDGEIYFEYHFGGSDHRVIQEYPGRIYRAGDTLRYQVPGRDVAVGAVDGDSLQLCVGAYAEVCQFSLGKKNPIGLETPGQLAGKGDPIFSASLRLAPAASPLFLSPQVDYTESFNRLDPFVLASPNQLDAGSCNYMANTGAMEILLNQHASFFDIDYDGDTDLSERFLMNASSYAPDSVVNYHIVDLVYAYDYLGGSMLSRDYPFAAGYVREGAYGQMVHAEPSETGAYFSASYSWIDDLPADWEGRTVATPDAARTLIFIDPDLDSQSIWNVGLMNDDIIARIKDEVRAKQAPVIVVYNHFLYWHATIVVGYDDNAYAGDCPMVHQSIDYFKEQGHNYAATKIEQHMAAEGGCSPTGVFLVRDSIYDGANSDPRFSYSDEYTYTEPYSARIIEHSYDWAKYLGNHAYTVHRR